MSTIKENKTYLLMLVCILFLFFLASFFLSKSQGNKPEGSKAKGITCKGRNDFLRTHCARVYNRWY